MDNLVPGIRQYKDGYASEYHCLFRGYMQWIEYYPRGMRIFYTMNLVLIVREELMVFSVWKS